MLGLDGLDAGPDWRGPLADRLLISSATAATPIKRRACGIAYQLAGLGSRLAGGPGIAAPKEARSFHFSLPAASKGFGRSTARPDRAPRCPRMLRCRAGRAWRCAIRAWPPDQAAP